MKLPSSQYRVIFFGMFKRRLGTLLKYLNIPDSTAQQVERFHRLLAVLIDIAFFVYAMNPRVRPTYQMSEIIMALSKSLEAAPLEVRENITKKIVDEATEVILNNCILESGDNVELLNLLIALRTLGQEYMYEEDFLVKLFCTTDMRFERDRFGYFQITTLLHYIQQDVQYQSLAKAISSFVKSIFEEDENWQEKAELASLFLDYVRCPYVDRSVRLDFIKTSIRHRTSNDLNARAIVIFDVVAKADWFFDWSASQDLAAVLRRKELRTAY